MMALLYTKQQQAGRQQQSYTHCLQRPLTLQVPHLPVTIVSSMQTISPILVHSRQLKKPMPTCRTIAMRDMTCVRDERKGMRTTKKVGTTMKVCTFCQRPRQGCQMSSGQDMIAIWNHTTSISLEGDN